MNKLTIYQMEQSSIEFKKTHTVNIGGMPKEGKPPKYFVEFQNMMLKFIKAQEQHWNRQEQFNQYVLDQFKKHGWTLNKIQTRLDNIVTKNNLKE